jgi:uncharacterized membrane protein YedE/YeeE
MKLITAFVFGVTFALGLGLGGMTQPAKIIAFLDVGGAWDPTLALVMGGAVLVGAVTFPWALRRRKALLGDNFVLPTASAIDAPLLIGAGIFGVGWGLSGYCPGPALVSLVTLSPPILTFVAFMAAGQYLGRWLVRPSAAQEPILSDAG